MASSRNTTITNIGIPFLFLYAFLAQVGLCYFTKVYVVYMGSRDGHDPDEILMQNHQFLTDFHGGSVEQARASHVYSYKHGFRGFAAKLAEDQASEMANWQWWKIVWAASEDLILCFWKYFDIGFW